eukprot:scaffold1_cov402-Prasinococcus_capsulatus_cf.AAC.47
MAIPLCRYRELVRGLGWGSREDALLRLPKILALGSTGGASYRKMGSVPSVRIDEAPASKPGAPPRGPEPGSRRSSPRRHTAAFQPACKPARPGLSCAEWPGALAVPGRGPRAHSRRRPRAQPFSAPLREDQLPARPLPAVSACRRPPVPTRPPTACPSGACVTRVESPREDELEWEWESHWPLAAGYALTGRRPARTGPCAALILVPSRQPLRTPFRRSRVRCGAWRLRIARIQGCRVALQCTRSADSAATNRPRKVHAMGGTRSI